MTNQLILHFHVTLQPENETRLEDQELYQSDNKQLLHMSFKYPSQKLKLSSELLDCLSRNFLPNQKLPANFLIN